MGLTTTFFQKLYIHENVNHLQNMQVPYNLAFKNLGYLTHISPSTLHIVVKGRFPPFRTVW